jgi:hypothetical protein
MKVAITAPITLLLLLFQVAVAQTCAGELEHNVGGIPNIWALGSGGIAAFAKMNINLDGYGRAYHPKNSAGGAVIHLCNAGKVYLPDGSSYQGSKSNATCTGRFMEDYKRIGDAGWQSSSVGAIKWYGVLGEGVATIHGREIQNVKPVLQKDGSGFYVSPTSLQDGSVPVDDQNRYINPLRVASAVVPGSLAQRGISMGTFGVAIDRRKKIAVPFVVGDGGPRIGEGSAALARLVAGKALTDLETRQNRSDGQVDTPDVLWVFFAGQAKKYDHKNEGELADAAKQAYEQWSDSARLLDCLNAVPKN